MFLAWKFQPLQDLGHHMAIAAVVAACAGFLLLVPPEWFRCFHAAHHRFTLESLLPRARTRELALGPDPVR